MVAVTTLFRMELTSLDDFDAHRSSINDIELLRLSVKMLFILRKQSHSIHKTSTYFPLYTQYCSGRSQEVVQVSFYKIIVGDTTLTTR